MIIPIRCFTCNNILAHKWETYFNKIQLKYSNDEVDNMRKERFIDVKKDIGFVISTFFSMLLVKK